ncbi:MAG TPA: DUF2281 domain-containing protein [Tepidisphaeraceae bacterium]|nr:DUF2281 domain-containing protein [Tepidisphaeraceae bacterium]
MNTITATLEADADGTLHLPLPPELRHRKLKVSATVEAVESEANEDAANSQPYVKGFGCLKGKIRMMPDFDEPLEDFREYTE